MKDRISRAEFLLYLGTLAITITGIQKIAKSFISPKLLTDSKPDGFGSGPYGGTKNS